MESTSSTDTQEVMTEKDFLKLYNYDFQNCPKFMEGWKKIRRSINENITESFIKAQVFFYSRQIEPIILKDYIHWLKSSGKEVKIIGIDDQDTDSYHPEKEPANNDYSDKCSEVETAGKHPANFGELIEMIQKGIKLPGVEELNIEPTNEKPSPAKLDLPKKPWET